MDNSDFNIDRLLFYNAESIDNADSEAQAFEEGRSSGYEEGKNDGYEEEKNDGIKEGETSAKEDIALEMLKNNFDVDLVARLSKLPKEKIEEFKNELK